MKIDLLIIDPQYDFCHPEGSLYVYGADDDMKRLANMINRSKRKIDAIHITLDQHNIIHIAHPVFWVDPQGRHPEPFTVITLDDVIKGNWKTTKSFMMEKATSYIKELSLKGRYELSIWPPHCIIGSLGATIMPVLHEALKSWEIDRFSTVNIFTKGENIWTEHYSAIKAEVPDPFDPKTEINKTLIDALQHADFIVVAGEALSHCVANTIKDIADTLGDKYLSRIVLLDDATSPVKGFENLAADFIKDMKSKGMKISNTRDFV